MAGKRGLALILAAGSLLFTACGAAAAEAEEPEIFSVDILSTGKSDCALIRMDGQTRVVKEAFDNWFRSQSIYPKKKKKEGKK